MLNSGMTVWICDGLPCLASLLLIKDINAIGAVRIWRRAGICSGNFRVESTGGGFTFGPNHYKIRYHSTQGGVCALDRGDDFPGSEMR